MKISILCFDLSDNAVGRADLLARLVAPLGEVEVIGPQSRNRVWEPVADGPVSHRGIPDRRLPGFFGTMRRLARMADGDLLYASKTRLGSAGVAYLRRALGPRRPVVLDIDDWEVGFYLRSGPWGTLGRLLNLGNPKGLAWTWLAERLTGLADGITVASRFLQERFGGTLIPHVRDTDAWGPGAGDGPAAREKLGVGREDSLVMFLGTARAYKGVADLAEAVTRLQGRKVRLAVVGLDPGSLLGRDLAERYPSTRIAGPIPFAQVPDYLAAADVVAVPQRKTPDTAGQVPAKLFDAMAMGRPIVATRVSMIPEILEDAGLLAEPGDPDSLARCLAEILDSPERAARLGERARRRAVERYSFAAARRDLFPLLEAASARAGARRR